MELAELVGVLASDKVEVLVRLSVTELDDVLVCVNVSSGVMVEVIVSELLWESVEDIELVPVGGGVTVDVIVGLLLSEVVFVGGGLTEEERVDEWVPPECDLLRAEYVNV